MTVELHLGDCLEVMRTMPDKSVDAVITDPPYYRVVDSEWDKQWQTLDEYLELGQTERREQIGTLRGEVERLRSKSDTWNILNSLGAVIAGVFAGLGWGK